MVKCTTCGHRWRAFQDRSEAEGEVPGEEMLAEGPKVAPENDIEFVAAPVTPKRASAAKRRPAGLFIGVGVAALLAAGGTLVVLRQAVADMAPATAPLFAAIGLPVDTLGLVIEGVKPERLFQGGRPVLSVTGAVRNIRHEPIEAPPIRLSLLDKSGKPVAALVADVTNARVPPGAKRYFAIALPNPPAAAHMLEVGFEARAEAPAPTAHVLPAAKGLDPVEAEPLAAGSPDALAKHD